mmetsp:Transcript_30469/g.73508  ORF Transcript_30469/g.73508 Transcript_30469/m.73508 type:complete len:107 (-) Transcript_30469:189-509(-)
MVGIKPFILVCLHTTSSLEHSETFTEKMLLWVKELLLVSASLQCIPETSGISIALPDILDQDLKLIIRMVSFWPKVHSISLSLVVVRSVLDPLQALYILGKLSSPA